MARPPRPGTPPAASSHPTSPFEGIDRVIVDGTNLLYRLGGGSPAPPAAIVGRIRAAVPAAVEIEVVFDGAGHGVGGRVAQRMHVRYSGRRPADEVIVDVVATGGPGAAARVLVVTDDRQLRDRLTAAGARTARLAWLTSRLDLPTLAAPAPGNRRPAPPAPPVDDDADRPGWKPGRGATTKTGPARRVPRHRRHPRPRG
jgi:rRNA-processing protein FCF1